MTVDAPTLAVPEWRRLAGVARRHGQSAFGPISISAAHFAAALLLLHSLPSAEFGQFSFVIVVSGLCLGLVNGLLGAPISAMVPSTSPAHLTELNIYRKVSLVLVVLLSGAMGATMLCSGVPLVASALFGLYGGMMSLRLFARTYAYTLREVRSVILSDVTYSGILVIGLGCLVALGQIHIATTALVMAVGATLALIPFGWRFAGGLVTSLKAGSVAAYRIIWRDLTRWSLLGVITTEVTGNAHAYLVTFICGSKAFALLAAGSLFMRPFSLISSALPDQERPAMARGIAVGDMPRVSRIGREFHYAINGIWLGTIVLAGVVLTWFPALIVKKGYDRDQIVWAVVMWSAITFVRGVRTPSCTLLQAAREFRVLADASTKSSVVALIGTLVLLLAAGPIASLGGILIGDIVMWAMIETGARHWRAKSATAPA